MSFKLDKLYLSQHEVIRMREQYRYCLGTTVHDLAVCYGVPELDVHEYLKADWPMRGTYKYWKRYRSLTESPITDSDVQRQLHYSAQRSKIKSDRIDIVRRLASGDRIGVLSSEYYVDRGTIRRIVEKTLGYVPSQSRWDYSGIKRKRGECVQCSASNSNLTFFKERWLCRECLCKDDEESFKVPLMSSSWSNMRLFSSEEVGDFIESQIILQEAKLIGRRVMRTEELSDGNRSQGIYY